MQRSHVRMLFILTVVLLMLVLVPVASAARPCIVAGAGTGEGFSPSTCQVSIHFNSNVGGTLRMSVSSPIIPERNGTFRATLDKDLSTVNETGLSTVATVVSSDNPSFWVGRQFLFACIRLDGAFYVLTDPFPWFIDRGNLEIRL